MEIHEIDYPIFMFDVIKPGETEEELIEVAAPDYWTAVEVVTGFWPHIHIVRHRGIRAGGAPEARA